MEGRKLHGALLDIALRGETVFRLADVIRERHIPFLFLTGHLDPDVPGRFKNVPILEKPCTTSDIVSLLRSEIQRSSADASQQCEPSAVGR